MTDYCGTHFNFRPGDGHTIGPYVQMCERVKTHAGRHAEHWQMTDAEKADDQEIVAEQGRKFRQFIVDTARRYGRQRKAEQELARMLREHPDEEFVIVVPVADD